MQTTNTETTEMKHEQYLVRVVKTDGKIERFEIRYGSPDKNKDYFRLVFKDEKPVKSLLDILNYIKKENIF